MLNAKRLSISYESKNENLVKRIYDKISGWFWTYVGFYFYRTYNNIKNIIRWIPILWKDRDFDQSYLIYVMKFKIERMLEYHEREDAILADYEKQRTVEGLRTALSLIQKTFIDAEYEHEWYDITEKKYGKFNLDFVSNEDKKTYSLETKYEREYTEEEIKKIEKEKRELMVKSAKKQKRAEDLTFRFIAHRINEWWD